MGKTTPAPNFKPLTGDDIESAFEIIEKHGGTGAFETPDKPALPERYWFPRFHGADDDADHYLSRVGIGPHDTDVETLVAWLQAPRNIVGAILALGAPGTGKTALIEAAVTHLGTAKKPRDLTVHVFTPDDTRESLTKVFVGEDHGDVLPNGKRSPFTLAPLCRAVKYGHIFYGDEAMRLDDGVWPMFYPLTDGRHEFPGGEVDGSSIPIHPDFRMVFSSNPMVRGASLPEPVASRCAGTTITVATDADLLRSLDIDESIIECWQGLGEAGLFQPQVRELRVADYWMQTDLTQAASAFIPEHCPESEREDVTNMVRTYLGGDLPADGRLVVK